MAESFEKTRVLGDGDVSILKFSTLSYRSAQVHVMSEPRAGGPRSQQHGLASERHRAQLG